MQDKFGGTKFLRQSWSTLLQNALALGSTVVCTPLFLHIILTVDIFFRRSAPNWSDFHQSCYQTYHNYTNGYRYPTIINNIYIIITQLFVCSAPFSYLFKYYYENFSVRVKLHVWLRYGLLRPKPTNAAGNLCT